MTSLAVLGKRIRAFGTLALIVGILFARGQSALSAKRDTLARQTPPHTAPVFDLNSSGALDDAHRTLPERVRPLLPENTKAQKKGKAAGPAGRALLQVKLVDLVPASLSGETNQDSEPFLAIQPANPQIMVASAFTPNPISATGNAPVYVSQDGGNTWVLNAIAPVQRMACDITHAMAAGENHPRGDLHAGTLACATAITLGESEATDVSSGTTMNVQSTRNNVDQPFVRALAISDSDHIYVGVNDFNQPAGHTATVDVSVDGGNTYKSTSIEARNTMGQDGPSVRPAVAADNTVYAAFFGWRKFDGKTAISDVVVVRDDAGATSVSPFQALKDP